MSDQEPSQELSQEQEPEQLAEEPAITLPPAVPEEIPEEMPAADTKAIIDGFWVCKLEEGNIKKVCKAETGTQAIEYFAAIVRCNPESVQCDPATSLPVDGYGCGLSKECFELNKSVVIIEAAFDKLR